MKNIFNLSILLILFSSSGHAQKIEITPQYGYQIGSKYNFYGGYIKLTDSDQYGFTVSIPVNSDVQAEFFWVQQNAAVKVRDIIEYPESTELTEVRVNHYQFAAVHTFGYKNEVVPFFGMSAGWSTFNPKEKIYNSTTKFTLGLTGGVKYFFSDHIGFRLQTQLLMPIDWGGVYYSSGGGSGVSVGGTLLQLNFSGGLIFAFGG